MVAAMPSARAICVFCGSSPGDDPAFVAAAEALGRAVAISGRALIYGGSKTGLMGAVADAALAAGGRVTGVIPHSLIEKEVAHGALTELRVVTSMHDRKAAMADLADAFVALPGGLGTLEELFEVWTWAQLGLHAKPVALLRVGAFFDPLIQFLDALVAHRFVRREYRDLLILEDDPVSLLARLDAWRPPAAQPKWIERGQE
jgi:uncharacterized protein (TIGR00730 family)